jgi:hypothetical protein
MIVIILHLFPYYHFCYFVTAEKDHGRRSRTDRPWYYLHLKKEDPDMAMIVLPTIGTLYFFPPNLDMAMIVLPTIGTLCFFPPNKICFEGSEHFISSFQIKFALTVNADHRHMKTLTHIHRYHIMTIPLTETISLSTTIALADYKIAICSLKSVGRRSLKTFPFYYNCNGRS